MAGVSKTNKLAVTFTGQPKRSSEKYIVKVLCFWKQRFIYILLISFSSSFQPLTFLSLGNAYLALKNVSGALEAFRQALKLTTRCPECESSLKLIRCMQFYPFLYNITSSVCSGKCLVNARSSTSVPVVIKIT